MTIAADGDEEAKAAQENEPSETGVAAADAAEGDDDEGGGPAAGTGLHFDEDEAAHTFRRRRLTYTKHHLETSAAAAAAAAAAEFGDISDDEDDEAEEHGKSSTMAVAAAAAAAALGDISDDDDEAAEAGAGAGAGRKRKAADDEGDDANDESAGADAADGAEPPPKRRRPSKDRKKQQRLETRVLHASAPPPHRRCRKHRLYQHPHRHDLDHLQHGSESAAAADDKGAAAGDREEEEEGEEVPAWRKRRLVRHSIDEDESLLPFPRDAVGIYSCHGVEPLYDSDYEHSQSDDESPTEGEANNAAVTAKINQDRGGIAFPYGGCPRTALFAAYDGHGEGGELVSQYALHEIQRRLEVHPSFGDDVEKAFKTTFVEVDEELRDVAEIEPLYAGTTAVVCLLRGTELSVANAGDSRAVLARRMEGSEPAVVPQDLAAAAAGSTDEVAEETKSAEGEPKVQLAPFDLSVDQNPDSPVEKERILSSGGYVSPPPEEGLSARVWLDPTFTQIGLAMARSIGDHAVKPVGVISEPVVTRYELTPRDEFMIVATDGVWEFIESSEAVDIVQGFLERGEGASRACQGLIEAAAAKWHEYEGDYRDDITALVVRFDGIWDHGKKGGDGISKGDEKEKDGEKGNVKGADMAEARKDSEGKERKEERGLDL